jgi:hypothetical protein
VPLVVRLLDPVREMKTHGTDWKSRCDTEGMHGNITSSEPNGLYVMTRWQSCQRRGRSPTIPAEGGDSVSYVGEGSRLRDQVFSGAPVFIPSGGSIRAEFCWDELYGLTVALYPPYRCCHIEDREGESIAT